MYTREILPRLRRIVPPMAIRTTMGHVNAPFDRQRVVAASDLIWFIAGHT